MKRQSREWEEFISFLTTVAGIAVIGITVALLVRLQRGLLGVTLSVIAVGVLAFWLSEVRGLLRKRYQGVKAFPDRGAGGPGSPRAYMLQQDLKDELWTYDLYDEDGETVLVAKVPGPEDDIMVNLSDGRLEIAGGRNFSRSLKIPGKVRISRVTYKNGVLVVGFTRLGDTGDKVQRNGGTHASEVLSEKK